MAKAKPKDGQRVSNPHLHARITFLQRASIHLATLSKPGRAKTFDKEESIGAERTATNPLSRSLATQIRAVARKSQIRLSRAIKTSICKGCDAQLIQGHATTSLENNSKGGSKSSADVKVVTCHACSAVKRFPVGAARQTKKKHRGSVKTSTEAEAVEPAHVGQA